MMHKPIPSVVVLSYFVNRGIPRNPGGYHILCRVKLAQSVGYNDIPLVAASAVGI
jgi:hypothetical protein